ncbi:MAG: DNA-directed RNA polymerase subunit B [Candidatus Thermoplasmatota archaeon]|nr:DNA-directed RNA polymerase subunit B [Candidatus Thermoplasmatota archaeon]
MRELVEAFFEEANIVGHHMESYNDFLPTEDNPESKAQKIVDNLRIGFDEGGWGKLKLDPEKVDGKDIQIRVGRKRDEDGEIEDERESTIRIRRPTVKEASGSEHKLIPQEARLRDLHYEAELEMKFSLIREGVEEEAEWISVGKIPVMIGSKICNLHPDNIDNTMEEVLNEDIESKEYMEKSYEDKLTDLGEDPLDPQGYYIVGGTERSLMAVEDLAANRVMCEINEKYGRELEVAKIFSQRHGFRAMTLMEKKKDGLIAVSVPSAKGDIPLIILMKALGMESDEEIRDSIVTDPEMNSVVYANIEMCQEEDEYSPDGVYSQQDALAYLERKFATGQAEEYRQRKIESILDRSLLPHIGDKEEDRMKKAHFLGRMAKEVLELSMDKRETDDKDHYANKRIKLAGDLLSDLFRVAVVNLLKDLKYQLERNYRKKGDMRIRSSIRPDLLTNKLQHAMATGNWVGGRTGISQLLDRTSNMATISHLRRVKSPLSRSQPHFEARELHPTHWGRLCPSQTPEGQNCGLVKNSSLMINVSKGIEPKQIEDKLFELGLKEMESETESPTKVYLNGALIGVTEEPDKFNKKLKDARRKSDLSDQVNVRYDEKMGEVILNSDEGRVRRPLVIVEDGSLNLTTEIMEEIQEGKRSMDSLFDEGYIEWVDAEEEEDVYVALYPFEIPEVCDECDQPLSEADVRWLNVGEGEDTAELECRKCGGEMESEMNITDDHTHMEVDPLLILGSSAGLIPYAEHNAAPRCSMGANMMKQALGLNASNYRYRPDTREHLLHYPQKSLLQTETMDLVNYNDRPAGQNFVVAVMSYHGYNMEDALIMSRGAVDRALARSTFFRTYTTEERRYPGGQEDKFEIPDPDVRGARSDQQYRKLDEDGIINPETKVEGEEVIVGKTSPPRFLEEDTDLMAPQKRRETSETVRPREEGWIDSVMLTESEGGSRLVKTKIRDQRVPELGDKFTSRHGQKGVIGKMVEPEDLPFTEDGVVPDMIVNPHAMPSRMTVAHMLEMLGGKVGSLAGRTIDGTPFSGESEDALKDTLKKAGFKPNGTEILYDGKTGKMLEAEIYVGVIYYQKLHHMVSGKLHMRSRGPVQILTRQPTEGRSRKGGLRFGEMERDCLIGHGAAMVIKDRLLDQSDGTTEYVCGNPDCGHIAMLDSNGELRCPVCGEKSDVHQIQTSFAFKLLMDELRSLGITMRLNVEDQR